jgi:hypothetical protein
MAFFGTLWASIGTGGLLGWGEPLSTIATILIGAALVCGGIVLWRSASRLPDTGAGDGDGNPMGRSFWLIFGLEGLAIAIASVVCNAIGRFDLFFSIMAIIVGLHFLPLVRLFGMPLYYTVGTLLCLIGLIGLALVPVQTLIGEREIGARSLIVGLGSAAVLWGVGFTLWVRGTALLRHANPVA